MGNISKRVALVTGGGRGIGREVCLKLAREGASVVVNDLDAEPAQEVVAEIVNSGGEAIAFPGSVTADGFAEKFVKAALDEYGDIHIIVNNAGYTYDAFIHKMSDHQFDAMYEVHAKAPFRILRAASHHIRAAAKLEAAEGRSVCRKIVNVSSAVALGGNAGQVNYSAMKSAVIGLTKTLSKEWGRLNVTVNCVAFGYIETRLTKATDEKNIVEVDGNTVQMGVPKAAVAGMKMLIPMGRAGTAEEAANGIYMFCSPDSDYISGQVVSIAGGLSL
ncbi:MAG: 3-oxoacyl-ACP reductase [Robiginitomaculum sp.]|nr:MAG: 3-oxoacyl-ACP reductase [Robiginitomaculum sp.]